MNSKVRKTKKQVALDNQAINYLSKEEINKKSNLLKKNLNHQPGEFWKPEESLLKTKNFHSSLMTCL